MCLHGYHHSGFMATPALWMQDVCIFFFKSLLLACPTQTNPPGSGPEAFYLINTLIKVQSR